MDPDTSPPPNEPAPSAFNYILGFLLVGVAWGFTTPFIRRAAVEFNARNEQKQQDGASSTTGAGSGQSRAEPSPSPTAKKSWLREKVVSIFWTVFNLLRTPAYSIPLVINLTGSVWFFLLVGQHELSLTVPITNSLAFLFTVLGEWWAEGKVISKETWLGMFLVLGGIALCVQSKT
ncbi:hypothetical protein FQN54_002617 [Arachnomyces sp. PD_36]|nr:hypothetical protein FQN54_002617 [Arachnomyces sp. PD_36]